ncbi:selenocysteine-specific translation elongation factor [Helicobacter sp. MIT 05-5293]|uniref:selenocysteine-specific translation elongation factor n=1 Tax=Helicobacter sp. MIT 05-5293 TaxID=1548149 RepID=UPI0010FE069C|nr:selenocysteine-specific translation elongation factor [Helicobacter sp. MIT 05-5293]TLD80198.1 selenocysteine-specific translation elongation factor [Helicobacter sp. MIT 05-5293]
MTDSHNDLIVGLAGHIDHGKTTLIKALNGFDGDELAEEKQRGITIDLSFSHLTLPSRNVSFIDVPGHNKLVKNMIAGAFGIDVLLLVISADDGIMPQTTEHLQIADMLGITQCICVITKIDKIQSQPPSYLQNLQKNITSLFDTLDMNLHAMIETSLLPHAQDSYHNTPINRLKSLLDQIPKPSKRDFGLFVYYIDRAFSIKGAGCVVTGSVLSGQCEVGQKLYVYHHAQEVSVRAIQIHDQSSPIATPSHRVALNLNKINYDILQRGDLISQKGFLRGFDQIDVGLFAFEDNIFQHNAHYQFFLGSRKINAKLCLLNAQTKTHSYGSKTMYFATLKCDEPVFGIFSQHFILRNESLNVIGGVILNPIIDPIKKEQRIVLLKALAKNDFSSAFSQLSLIHKKGFGLVSSTQRFCLSHAQSLEIAQNLDAVFVDKKSLTLYPLSQLELLKNAILEIFARNKSALLSAQSLTYKFKWASESFLQKALDELVCEHFIEQNGSLYISKHCQIKDIKAYLQDKIYQILLSQDTAPLAPYNIYDMLDIDKKAGDEALKALCQAQKVVRITHNVFITHSSLNALIEQMRDIIRKHSYIDVAILKNYTQLSRKYLISYLEYLDQFDDIQSSDNKRFFKYNPPTKNP